MGDLSLTHEPEAQRAAADLSRKQGKGGCILSLGSRQAGIDPFLGGFWGGGASKPSQVTMLQRARYGYSTNNHSTRGERRGAALFPDCRGVFRGGGNLGLHMYPFYLVHEGPHLMLASRRVRLHGTWYAGERKAPNFSSARTLARRLSYSLRYLFFCIVQYLRVQSR